MDSNKKSTITALLCVFVGMLGIHNFYCKNLKKGLLQIFWVPALVLGLISLSYSDEFCFLAFFIAGLMVIISARSASADVINISCGNFKDGFGNKLNIVKWFKWFKWLILLYVMWIFALGVIICGGVVFFFFDDEKANTKSNAAISKETEYLNEPKDKYGTLLYSGHIYKTIQVGNQTWMAENLKVKKGVWYCYGGNPDNCQKYGMLYDWKTANSACPEGWRLPTSDDWSGLFNLVGGENKAGDALKTTNGWISRANGVNGGTNVVGFSALPAGARNEKNQFINGGYSSFFWSSTGSGYEMVNIVGLNYDRQSVSVGQSAKYFAFSARCVKSGKSFAKEQNDSNEKMDSINKPISKNHETKKYKSVKIGNQTWMAENLNWKTSNSKCYKGLSSNCKRYGGLYNWEDARVACPKGWHLPSLEEWEELVDYVGGKEIAGKALKSERGWKENGNGLNAYGFSVFPAGSYVVDYSYNGYSAQFWSSTDVSAAEFVTPQMGARNDNVSYLVANKYDYYSIRCIENDN